MFGDLRAQDFLFITFTVKKFFFLVYPNFKLLYPFKKKTPPNTTDMPNMPNIADSLLIWLTCDLIRLNWVLYTGWCNNGGKMGKPSPLTSPMSCLSYHIIITRISSFQFLIPWKLFLLILSTCHTSYCCVRTPLSDSSDDLMIVDEADDHVLVWRLS